MNQSILTDQLAKPGLSRIAPDITKLVQASIRWYAEPREEKLILVGASKLGGLPDLPPAIEWPMWQGIPMSFIAQVRLEDIASFSPASALPSTGLISFFYNANQDTYGDQPEDRDSWRVFYFQEAAANSSRVPFPKGLPVESQFASCGLKCALELTLPVSPAQHIPNLDWSEDEIKHYEDLLANFPTPEDHSALHHRMFGHPEQLQDDMQLECALISNGVKNPDDPRAALVTARKGDWNLLLQVDSDENAKMKWATAGMLYFWIEDQALKQRQFDRTWLILQAE